MKKPISKKIGMIRFALFSPEQIKKISTAKIVTPELYDIDGYPVDGGLMDLRLGAVDPGVRCRTCGGRLKECLGHPGRIDLARSVIHLKYVPLIEMGLRCFCHKCGKLLLADKNLKKHPPSQRAKKAKDAKKCPHCEEIHEKVKLDKPTNFYIGKKRLFPTEVREVLANLQDDDLRKIGVNPHYCRPEWAVLTSLLVPPVTVRPSIILESGVRSEDDLTHKLSDIIRANQRLWENLNAGAPEVIIEDLWDLLQYHVTTFFDNTIGKIPPARHRSGQPLKTITERIKGKEGRIRHNLAGKRVNYSARTVISPDPFIKMNEVGIPFEIARVITVAETVTTLNLESMKELIRKGEVYPGANYVIRPDGKKKKITEELKEEICNELVPGYKIERHLVDGDIVLFNRHPTLHKQGLMAHYVKVLPCRTFRLHPAAAAPYNADYDGDEMNIHSPQTEEARAESKVLLDINQNIISSKNNMNLCGTISDSITGAYLLGKDSLTKSDADMLLYSAGIMNSSKSKNISGMDVFSQAIPKGTSIKMPSEITGTSTFGTEDGKMVKIIDAELGRDATVDAINKAFTIGAVYLSRKGYTLALEDLNVSEKVKQMTQEIINEAEKKTLELSNQFIDGTLAPLPGKTMEETRETKILQVLNEVRTEVAKVVKANFPVDGNVNKMITPGAAGSMLNITQIGCVVGQQALGSKRFTFGYCT